MGHGEGEFGSHPNAAAAQKHRFELVVELLGDIEALMVLPHLGKAVGVDIIGKGGLDHLVGGIIENSGQAGVGVLEDGALHDADAGLGMFHQISVLLFALLKDFLGRLPLFDLQHQVFVGPRQGLGPRRQLPLQPLLLSAGSAQRRRLGIQARLQCINAFFRIHGAPSVAIPLPKRLRRQALGPGTQ